MLRSRFWLQNQDFGASVGAICIIFRDLSVPLGVSLGSCWGLQHHLPGQRWRRQQPGYAQGSLVQPCAGLGRGRFLIGRSLGKTKAVRPSACSPGRAGPLETEWRGVLSQYDWMASPAYPGPHASLNLQPRSHCVHLMRRFFLARLTPTVTCQLSWVG